MGRNDEQRVNLVKILLAFRQWLSQSDAVILAAGAAAPVVTALAGAGYGLFEGFIKGAEDGPLSVPGQAIETCKKWHGHVTQTIVNGIRDAATKEPDRPK